MRRGTEQEAAVYCKKGGDYWECGTIARGQGSRTDVEEFKKLIKEGKTDLELMDVDFNGFNRFMKSVDRYRMYKTPVRTHELVVHLFYGAPGTGKTKMAYELMPDLYTFPIGPQLWSDGYCGQTDVLLDDFSGQMRLVDTLRFLDRYPIQIPKKGGFNWWCPNRIIITTNRHPSTWYKFNERADEEQALRRRIHHIWDFDDQTWGDLENQPHHITGPEAIKLWWP